jgi:TonB family protein
MGFRVLMLALLAASFPGWAASAEGQSIDGHFKGWADIDASGRLQAFAPDGKAHPAIAKALQQELQRVAFTPARTQAGPAAIRTYLSGGYRLVAEGDGYALQLTEFRAGAKALTMDMPQVPLRTVTMDEESWVRTSFVIDRNGRARDVVVEASGGASELRRNVVKAMPHWRFEPESIAGVPVEAAVRQEFVFYSHDRPPPVLPPCPADAGGRVLAPDQTSCLHVMQIELGEPQIVRSVTVP